MQTFIKVLALLTPRELRNGVLVMILVIIMAILETVGVASIIPFLTQLGDANAIENNEFLGYLYNLGGFSSSDTFLAVLGGGAFLIVLFSAAFRIMTTYAINRYTQMRRHSVGSRLLETYLRQPYQFFLNRHSGDMAKSILSEVDQLTNNVLKPAFEAIAYSFVSLAIITFLIFNNPMLALVVAVVIGGSYVLTFTTIQSQLRKIGRDRANANTERFTTAGEALGGIKDIKLLGREQAYLSRFKPSSIRFSKHQATNATLSEVPKYVIEAIGIGGVIALSLYLISSSSEFGEVLPVLGLYAFAGFKLLPSAQKIYSGLAKLRFGSAAVDDIYVDLIEREKLSQINNIPSGRLKFEECIELNNLSFSYPDAEENALNDLFLKIPKGSSIGLVGGTGAGKTTLVDIILGLLASSEGEILVDSQPISDKNLRLWQKSLGYVPQDIFLVDASIEENIALGVPKNEIDTIKVNKCAKMAQVHDFIVKKLPNQYETAIGERGVRLSGGQRQRIGIARALYHEPDILVFDEATSALDNITEKAVMEAVSTLNREKTIIIIAHRLSTVKNCDQIILLEEGKIIDRGTYTELSTNSDSFKKMSMTS